MKVFYALLALVSIGAGTLTGQSAPTPAFEVADVHASAPRMSRNPGMKGGVIRDGVYELRNATMLDLIRTAYSIESDKILGGPSWLEVDRFDMVGKPSAGTTMETAQLMLRTLLGDRFNLVVRPETRAMTTWVLSRAGEDPPKLVRSRSAGVAPACQPEAAPPNVKAVCRNLTIARFIERLPDMGGPSYALDTITDATGLTGAWDFEFVFTTNRGRLADLGSQGISLFDALEKQLGLKLEHKNIVTPVLVVESASRTPAANPPGIETLLPPPRAPELEVADIKPGTPGAPTRSRVLPTGMIDTSNVTLRQLINIAWGINGNELVAGPKWMDTARFDVVGRAFAGADAELVDNDFLSLALRQLLVDRFKIAFHYEDRPVNAYALVAGNVKMIRADPSVRTRCYTGVPPGARDPRQENPPRAGVVTCENVTMKDFAERLRFIAPGYFEAPIVEMTGLEGGWTFTLNWSAIGLFPGGVNGIGARGGPPGAGGDAGAAGVGVASVPNGAITLPEAVERQLGLKLQMGKRPVPVLVIDQILEKPIG